jgi:hypothetical protein
MRDSWQKFISGRKIKSISFKEIFFKLMKIRKIVASNYGIANLRERCLISPTLSGYCFPDYVIRGKVGIQKI